MIYSIKGKPECVKEAESVISEFIASQPDFKNIELIVPKVCVIRFHTFCVVFNLPVVLCRWPLAEFMEETKPIS